MIDVGASRQLTRREGSSSLLWPTLFALVGILLMSWLGVWQLQRLAWKNGLIAQIEARTRAEPIALADALRRAANGDDVEYTRVRASGRFVQGREWYYWAPATAGPGWHVYAPLQLADGTILIVNRGFVTDADRDPARRPENFDGDRDLVGLLRRPEVRGMFTPDADRVRNQWYARDLGGMAATLPPGIAQRVAPVFLDAERAPEAGTSPGTTPAHLPPAHLPRGGTTRLELPNSHLQYAGTWFALALTLAGVYAAFVWSRRQAPASLRPPEA